MVDTVNINCCEYHKIDINKSLANCQCSVLSHNLDSNTSVLFTDYNSTSHLGCTKKVNVTFTSDGDDFEVINADIGFHYICNENKKLKAELKSLKKRLVIQRTQNFKLYGKIHRLKKCLAKQSNTFNYVADQRNNNDNV